MFFYSNDQLTKKMFVILASVGIQLRKFPILSNDVSF